MQDGTWHHVWIDNSNITNAASTSVLGIPVSISRRRECTRVLVVDKQKTVVGYHTEGKC